MCRVPFSGKSFLYCNVFLLLRNEGLPWGQFYHYPISLFPPFLSTFALHTIATFPFPLLLFFLRGTRKGKVVREEGEGEIVSAEAEMVVGLAICLSEDWEKRKKGCGFGRALEKAVACLQHFFSIIASTKVLSDAFSPAALWRQDRKEEFAGRDECHNSLGKKVFCPNGHRC